jgi:DNA polymerase IIIc chi subunit
VNPRHLENVTTSKNNKDAYARGLVDLEKKSRSVKEAHKRMDPAVKELKNKRISLARHRYEKNKAKGVMLDAAAVWGVKERLNAVMDVIEDLERKS